MGPITRKGRSRGPKPGAVKSTNSSLLFGNRIAELEKTMVELTKRVEELERRDRVNIPMPLKRKRGPKPKLSKDELLRRRDTLILWLEENWPELSHAIKRARKAEQLIPIMRKMRPLSSHHEQPPFIKEWNRYWPKLWEFIARSGRYYNNPRNIANALAGVPELSWKRSFDVCSSHPSHLSIQPRAVLDYLLRNVPERLKAIRAANGDVERIRDILESRTKDNHLVMLSLQAMHVAQYLKEGEPVVLKRQ
jgi:hypothetical protein